MTASAAPSAAPNRERVVIFDTTLRDGEQSPGAAMNLDEKLRIAALLDDMGVDVIEAGFPITSPGDFKAVSEIAKKVRNASVCGLARAKETDIKRCADAVADAVKPRIHTFISTSPLHMKYKLQMAPEAVLQSVIDSVTYARSLVEDVEWSAEDGSRTEHDFLCRCVEAAIKAGARTINIPDTVGYAEPEEYGALIAMLLNRVPNADQAIFSVHCHNDLGLAVANSLAAVRAGARQVECTINGLGERAGNAALEEIVMGLRTRADRFPFVTGVKTEQITRVSQAVSHITGFVIQPNKAIVGKNAFSHESGIHQDGVLKHAATYEIMTPESVGLSRTNITLGKLSGRHALRDRLKQLGYDLDDAALNKAFESFKHLADRKREIFDEDLIALVDETPRGDDVIQLVALKVQSRLEKGSLADIILTIDGDECSALDVEGNGVIDATFKAIKLVTKTHAKLKLYQVASVSGGTDAQADVTVRLEQDHPDGGVVTATGRGVDPDTLAASAKAYIQALNRLQQRQSQSAPTEQCA